MVDTLKKVKSGDALKIPAATFNTFIDAARDFRSRQQGRAQTARQSFRSSGIVLIKNASGYDCGRFGVLGIDSPVITPVDNEESFKNTIALRGVVPTENGHAGRFVILAEPLADGTIGRAFVDGVCPVKIDVTDEDHQYADVDDGETSKLKSGGAGAAQILWAESGTGVKWAIVRLGAPTQGHGLFACLGWQDGGTTDGDVSHACNRTYKCRTLDATGPDTGGVLLGTNRPPHIRRWASSYHYGKYVCPPVTGGGVRMLGYRDENGTFQIWDANEVPHLGTC